MWSKICQSAFVFTIWYTACFLRQLAVYLFFCFFFFLLWGGTCSLCMPALRPTWQAGPMHNPGKVTSVVLSDTMVCVMCSCCVTSPYREVCTAKGGIGSWEILCHDIYPARPISTVSLAANTYCMMEGHSSCAPRTVGPKVQFSGACEQSHWWLASAYSRRPSVTSGLSSD